MTVCGVCGGDEFTLEDGFYFCNECHTQSQDIREIVTDDLLYSVGSKVKKVVVSEQTKAQRKRSKERQAEIRGVRSRITWSEALNQLLRRWTTSLVARGAPAHLPETVARLWETVLRADRDDMTTSWVFALLWLALVDCEPLCRLSDLMRWARQDIVPFYTAANELPEDVMFSHMKIQHFQHIKSNGMQRLLTKMLRTLPLSPPPQPPLRQLLRRYLAELVLPARLADVVVNVARRAPPLDRLVPEADALALLLLLLKMLFGLDDVTEIRNSEVAAARNQAVPDGPRWFVLLRVAPVCPSAALGRWRAGLPAAAGGSSPRAGGDQRTGPVPPPPPTAALRLLPARRQVPHQQREPAAPLCCLQRPRV